jgi:hypothetical protein
MNRKLTAATGEFPIHYAYGIDTQCVHAQGVSRIFGFRGVMNFCRDFYIIVSWEFEDHKIHKKSQDV